VTHLRLTISIVAVLAFALFVTLCIGAVRMRFLDLDRMAGKTRGAAPRLAAVFTISGRNRALTVLSVAGFFLCGWGHVALWIPITLAASQVLSQTVVEAVKRLVRRARPDDWLLRHESGFSYPSGHASTAVTFYGSWLLVILLASAVPEPAKLLAAAVLGIWMLGIAWSRIALAAHYLTDVVGGACFGCSWIGGVLLVILHIRGRIA
jgi:undecaprenyl-diphosphatase